MAVIRIYPVGEAVARPAPDATFSPVQIGAVGDLSSFGGNQARDLQVAGAYMDKASDSLGNIALREAEIVNEAYIQDINNQFIKAQQEMLYTGPDAFYRKQGKAALDAAPAATQQLLDLQKAMLDQTKNAWQKQRLTKVLNGHVNEVTNGMSRFVAEQSRAWEKSVADGRQQLILNDVALTYNDTDKIDLAAANAESVAREQARLSGLQGDAETALVVQKRSDVYATAITARLQNGQNRSALALYDKNKDKLDEKDNLRLASAIKSTRTDVQADDWIMQSTPNEGRQDVRRFFEAKGYSPEASAALAAHFYEESRNNPNATNPKDGRDGSDSIGMGQWNGSRSKDLMRFAKDNNLDPRERRTQLEFAAWELDNTEGAAGKALKGAKSIEEANRAVLGYFRPAVWNTNKDARLELSRAAFAEKGVGSDKLSTQGLINAAMNDPGLSLETKTAVVTKLQKQSSQLEAARTAAIKGLDDSLEATTQMMIAAPTAYKKGVLGQIADGYEAAGDRSKAVNTRILASMEDQILAFSTSPSDAQSKIIEGLLPGKAKALATGIAAGTNQEAAEATKAAKDAFALVKTAAENGIPLTKQQDKIKEVVNLALKGRDRLLVGEITDWVNGRAAAESLGQAPQAAQTQLLADLKARIEAGDQSAQTLIQLDQFEKITQQQRAAFQKDAYAAGTSIYPEVGRAVPINWADQPDNLAAAIGVRATQARQITERSGFKAIPFSDPEIQTLRTKLQDSPPEVQARIMKTLATAPADMLPGIAAALAGKDEGDALSRSYGAALAFYADKDPASQAAADQVLKGAQIIQADGAGGRKPAVTSDVWQAALQERIGSSLQDINPQARAVIADAVAAAYVYQMNKAGKQGEKTDPDVLNTAIKTVMGEAITKNGQMFFPPQRGMTSYQFDGVLGRMTDGDLQGAMTLERDPVTADVVRRRGVFTNVGDGLYKVRIPDPRRGGDLAEVMLPSGQALILDAKSLMQRAPMTAPALPPQPGDPRRRAPASPTANVEP